MIMPIDIENKVFKKSKFGGYDINDVESFLEKLIIDYENLFRENNDLKAKLNATEDSIDYLSSLEEGITHTIENSQAAADEIKAQALQDAITIREQAERETMLILEAIKLDIRAKEIEYEQIKKQMQIYKIKLNSMLEAQLKILNEEE